MSERFTCTGASAESPPKGLKYRVCKYIKISILATSLLVVQTLGGGNFPPCSLRKWVIIILYKSKRKDVLWKIVWQCFRRYFADGRKEANMACGGKKKKKK